ncbi:hypothetical protein ILT44_11940 [Microvirga sp. BT689]|uniref:hypothetical protein n=1 Tax=Microvirga arvi TaxID=2778731 RepID=UPI001951AD8E|nr:hypothetical protein [Microvirga arvi]MBM6580895.1 hypothetical protein [Microvirga arvi]
MSRASHGIMRLTSLGLWIGVETFASTSALPETLWIQKTECHANEKYFIIEQTTRDGSPRHIVRSKSHPDQTFACLYEVKDGDFELNDASTRYSLRDLKLHFLILEDGPGPGRFLDVYDLRTRERILNGHFFNERGQSISDEEISYWETEGNLPGTCKKYGENIKSDTVAVIEREVVFEFQSRSLKKSKKTRCINLPVNIL